MIRYLFEGWFPSLLVLGIFGLSYGNLNRYVFILLAPLGLYLLLKKRREWRFDRENRLLFVMFACIWLPMLFSMPDAADIGRAFGAVSRYLIYILSGLAVLLLSWTEFSTKILNKAAFLLLLFWMFDGLLQFFTGANVLGYPQAGGRLSGMFGEHSRLGPMLVILSPLFFESVRVLSIRWGWGWLLLIPYFSVIIIGGSRQSWMILMVSLFIYGWYYFRMRAETRLWRPLILRAIIIAAVAFVILGQLDWLSARTLLLTNLVSGDYQLANQATSLRLPLWQAAWDMISGHWFNGVGVRNYGTVFLQCCYEGQIFTDRINAHPHLFIGEIAAETGLLGVAGYVVFLLAIFRELTKKVPSTRQVWLMSAFLAAFPLSSSMAFYAIYSSSLLWLLLLSWLVLERQARLERNELEN